MKNCATRILSRDYTVSGDTWATHLNNNDLIVGPSGAGKTRGYVKPNLLQGGESYIVADPKGSLLSEVGPVLEQQGYRVMSIDFCDLSGSYGYNPLDYIRGEREGGRYNQQDVATIASALCPLECQKDPYWDHAAQMYCAAMIGYVLECLPREEHTLEYVAKLLPLMADGGPNRLSTLERLFEELRMERPDSFVLQKYDLFRSIKVADRMDASIRGILAGRLSPLTFDDAARLFSKPDRVDFAALGREKTAVFLSVSDTDRSMDKLVNLFYTQAMQALCRSADRDYPDHRLKVPVRFILDDFATNTVIPDFDNLTSVIRSREIAVSVIIQSLTQLEGLYGQAKAITIVNNCDHCLYLGGQDTETARYFSAKVNKTVDSVLSLPLDAAYLFVRGQKARRVEKYRLEDHPLYPQLPEARERAAGRDAPAPVGEETQPPVFPDAECYA